MAQKASQFQYVPASQRPPAGQKPPENSRHSALFDQLFRGAEQGGQQRVDYVKQRLQALTQIKNNPGPQKVRIHCDEKMLDAKVPYYKQCIPAAANADSWCVNTPMSAMPDRVFDIVPGANIFICPDTDSQGTINWPLSSIFAPNANDCSSTFANVLDGAIIHELMHVIGISPPSSLSGMDPELVAEVEDFAGYGIVSSGNWAANNIGQSIHNADSYRWFALAHTDRYKEFNWAGDGRAKNF
ncbi:MAG: hypothetical protein Q9160_009080 [Pyrenula sp. 1 TL-2023]